MRIMSLNGWGGTLHAPLIDYLVADPVDVLCLQEVIHTPDAPKEWLTYRDGDHTLPQRADFFGEVAAALPDHEAIFCPAAQGVLWDDDVALPSRWGLATFVSRRLPIVAQRQGFVHKTFSPHGYGEHPRSRSAHAVRVYDYAGERAVTIAHMHGLRDLAGKMDTPERKAQAERLAALTRSVAEPGDGIVVCGDFNVEPGSETLAILSALGLSERVTAGGFDGTRTSHYVKPGRFADYMLVSETLPVRDFQVVRAPEVSDHCPLVLDI